MSKHRRGYVDRLDFGCANPGQGIAASQIAGPDCRLGPEGGQSLDAVRLALRYAPAGSPVEINVIADVSDDNSEPTASKLLYANSPGTRSYVANDAMAGVPYDIRFLTAPESYTTYASYVNGGNFTTVFGSPYQEVPGSYALTPQSGVRSCRKQ